MDSRKILIAESGATKTAWRLCQQGKIISSFESVGLNPSSLSPNELYNILEEALKLRSDKDISALYFYGAGLKFQKDSLALKQILQKFLPESLIEIENDLTAAVRSTGRQEGLVCILGTGSNACLYRDGKLIKNYGGHGYLLGDEGSGMDLGKHLLKGLLEGDFLPEIRAFIEEKEEMDIGKIRASVYESLQPNKKLASFALYLSPWKSDPGIAGMLHSRFRKFLKSTVCKIEKCEGFPLDFVGGISANFSDEIRVACKELGLQSGRYYQSPIENLIVYHADH